MIKKILGISFCLVFTSSFAFAQTTPDELMEKLKTHRNSIYTSLNLSQEQVSKINEIDSKHYVKLEPELVKISFIVNKISDIAESDNCTIEAVNEQKENYKLVQDDITSLRKDYDKEFKTVLTPHQKLNYRIIRAKKRAELRREVRAEIKRLREEVK